ncbi:tail fiber domain-containing protein [Litorilituus lipolyticus]|uniref:Tail fiber domain-containing protein n=1 Tax=Litorilituus lipolyticus TaxID=2491017 RepID=A0A502L053_9GAMM|nr:tail fiber domain-containing protein [Litorilituus lipolyticus]TPH17056.1 tail fiber domain-containing protein [Litorilituus lipolyticus]
MNIKNITKLSAISLAIISSYTAQADQVILDDLIVDGSICVGQDCVNGESFGFDTLRLKENNLRIRAVDTSNSASFPTRDWQITFNDSSNGGANKFSIDDIDGGRTPFTIEAGAPSHSLYVDDAGRIGLGTSTPVVNIHVKEGNTPTLRLEQDGSSGFTPQTWDVAGNEANFFVRDATNGSTLPFKIKPGAPTDSVIINSSGYVGVGTTNFTEHYTAKPVLSVSGDNNAHNAITFDAPTDTFTSSFIFSKSNTPQWLLSSRNDYSNDRFVVYDSSVAEVISFEQGGKVGLGVSSVDASKDIQHRNGAYLSTSGEWMSNSSRSLKDNIVNLSLDMAIDTLTNLNPVTYNYKVSPDDNHVGFVAEDVPELVASETRKHLTAIDIVAVLTKVLQEQQEQIKSLSARLEGIESLKTQ